MDFLDIKDGKSGQAEVIFALGNEKHDSKKTVVKWL